jgi:large subunit ribosomal protein L10
MVKKKQKIMNKIEKLIINNSIIYLIDISGMNANLIYNFRKCCYTNKVIFKVVKNNLLKKALNKYECSYHIPKGSTAIMISNIHNLPAKIIQEFRHKNDKPLLKSAIIEDYYSIGDGNLRELVKMKSPKEFISDLIILLKYKLINIINSIANYYKIIIFDFIKYKINKS